jgi:hypothetical protein
MDTVKRDKFLFNGKWRTGRICCHCGLWEYSKDTVEEMKVWMTEPQCNAGDGDGHLWRHPYQHEIEYHKAFEIDISSEWSR